MRRFVTMALALLLTSAVATKAEEMAGRPTLNRIAEDSGWAAGYHGLALEVFEPYAKALQAEGVMFRHHDHWPRHGWQISAETAYSKDQVHLESGSLALVGAYSGPRLQRPLASIRWQVSEAGAYRIKAHFTAQDPGGSDSCVFVALKSSSFKHQTNPHGVRYLNPTGIAGEPIRGFIGRAVNQFKDATGDHPAWMLERELILEKDDELYFSVLNTRKEDRMDYIAVEMSIEKTVEGSGK